MVLACIIREVGAVMVEILARFDWRVVGMLFHNHDVGKGVGNSPCHFALAAVYAELDKQGRQSVHKSFDETNSSVNFTQLLVHIAQRSRSESIAPYCALPTRTREHVINGAIGSSGCLLNLRSRNIGVSPV